MKNLRVLICWSLFSIPVTSVLAGGPSKIPSVQQVSCDLYMDTMPISRTTSTGEVEVMNGVYQGVAQQYDNLASQVLHGVHFRARVNPASGSSNNLKVTAYNVAQGLPGSIIVTQNISVPAGNAIADYYVYFSNQVNISGSIIVSVEPLSTTTDDFFIERNSPPDGQNLNLIKVKQANQWFKNLAAGDPLFDYDFMILPLTVKNLQASFTNSATGGTVSFTNTSQNAGSYFWDFGDGNTDISPNPQHTYAATGNYTVHLYAYRQGLSSCVDSTATTIQVTVSGISYPAGAADIRIKGSNSVTDVLLIESMKAARAGVYLSNGKICKELDINPGINSIDLGGMETGVYIFRSGSATLRFLKVKDEL